MKRVFITVLDSFGIGGAKDAPMFGDTGADTLGSLEKTEGFDTPCLRSLGLYNIDGVSKGGNCVPCENPIGSYCRAEERSNGKDTTVGHWEIAGIYSEKPLPVYPQGFPCDVITEFSRRTGREVLCNKPYSGTDVIRDYGREHIKTGALIVYTSADSVFQIAAHEDVVPIETLYEYCRIAREMLTGAHCVGRVIARPFTGEYPYTRTSRRHDFSANPPSATLLDVLSSQGYDTVCIGKIGDIFNMRGVSDTMRTASNDDGMQKSLDALDKDFNGLCFINLVEFDSAYGHRRNAPGYAQAIMAFDRFLPRFLSKMTDDDALIITADHGCDPMYKGTDHTRENIPVLVYGKKLKAGVNLGTRKTYSDIAATVSDMLEARYTLCGESFYKEIL